jgi:hypothetical protein
VQGLPWPHDDNGARSDGSANTAITGSARKRPKTTPSHT